MDKASKKLKGYKKLFKKHLLEFIFLTIALIFTIVSFISHKKTAENLQNQLIEIEQKSLESLAKESVKSKIYVDISGAVENPDVYVVSESARLIDVLKLAGGLSANADRDFFYRNFNLAQPVFDGQKIYVPSKYEIWRGIITEPRRIFDFTNYERRQVTDSTAYPDSNSLTSKVNINTASLSQLEALPGIGKVTAQKIIDNRPYSSIEELLQKKILKQSVYEAVKNRLTL